MQYGTLTTELQHPDHMSVTAGKVQENGKKIKKMQDKFSS